MHRLADETSPYLRQHADNPVDWYPWGPEAFEVARATDRPILLSIGYSACHWCHVMAHESFEDPATAAVVNRLFVPVKVDREERPDVDAVYMEAVQAMTGAGGWPLTAFCTPDGEAFFCGTYFPREPTHGRPSFLQVCEAVDDAWRTKRDDLLEQAGHVTAHLRASTLAASSEIPGIEALAGVCADLLAQHDPTDGGFGVAPKFPQTMSLEVLLREHVRSGGAPQALAAVVRSLDAMAAGGIHDHLGGGFARYSVDRQWLVPHFEKMLYDQALLARTYLHAWQVTGLERFLDVVEDTIGYVLDHLQHPSGGWFAAEDADSEGVEGKYYVWTPDQVRDALGADAPAALAWWGVTPGGNFEGATILNRLHAPPDEAEPAEISVARARLVSARAERVHPGMDDKVLTEWNALFLATLAEAAAATGNEAWLCAAVTNAEFLLAELRRPDGRWLRSWQDDGTEGRARHLALATDHAALVDAFVRVGEATGQARWIDEARQAADAMIELFWDHEGTGLFTTGHDAERLIVRAKDLLDSATPSANSLAAVALLRLAALTGETRWHDRATEIVGLLAPTAVRQPGSLGHLLGALDLLARGIDEIAIVGDLPDLVEAVHGHYLPGAVVAWGERYASPLWEGRIDGLAYVCRDFSCLAPVSTIEALLGQLEATTTTAP